MSEHITLDNAIHVDPGATVFSISVFHIERHPSIQVIIGLQESDEGVFIKAGKHITVTVTGDEAQTLIRQLNTLDFSVMSLEKRLITWCQSNSYLGTGAVSGTPDIS